MSLRQAFSDPPRPDPATMTREQYLHASPPIFGSRFVDCVTRVPVWAVPMIFLPAIGAAIALGTKRIDSWQVLVWILVGYVVWTLTEYWLHRFVFHFEPDHPLGQRLHWMVHGVHHDHPQDPLRLVMPPTASIPLALIFVGIFHLVLPAGEAWALVGGFLGGYLIYDMTHYYVHHRRPRGRIGRKLRELHMRHHFQDHHRGFGVSAPWWDRVFGTATR
ncbi:MAG: fatty acid hydroxylase, partial [Actinobacteria bacterium]|nr:fatty acid hydroxylase [Actinomycetota bacterium]